MLAPTVAARRLFDAIRDGDRIYGTMLGVRLDNAGTGLPLKPHPARELRCLRDAQDSKQKLCVHCADGNALTSVVMADWL